MTDPGLSFCMVTTFYPPYHFGGEAMYLYRLVNALAERGHRVTVVHCVDSYRMLTKEGPRGEFPHHPGVTVRALESPGRSLSPLVTYLSGQPGLKRGALEEVFAEPFDVVHFHLVTLFGPGVIELAPPGALRLYTAHDHWLVCPMYDLWRFNRELCDRPVCLRCQASFRRPPQLWRYTSLLDRMLARIDLFLAPSRSTIEQHRRRGFAYPMHQLPYFLPADTTLTTPVTDRPAGSRAGRPYFLFVGRLVKLKGAQTLVDAFRSFTRADLLIAGDGAYDTELRRQAEGYDHIRFLGRVHPEKLKELYRGAVATLVPSLVYETFGFITLESLAQRTPVVATALGAVGELAEDSGGGLTYTTEAELVGHMGRLLDDSARRDELGARGHRAFLELWSEEPHIDRYMELVAKARAARMSRSREAVPA